MTRRVATCSTLHTAFTVEVTDETERCRHPAEPPFSIANMYQSQEPRHPLTYSPPPLSTRIHRLPHLPPPRRLQSPSFKGPTERRNQMAIRMPNRAEKHTLKDSLQGEDVDIDEEGTESESEDDEDGMRQLGSRRWSSEPDYSLIPLREMPYLDLGRFRLSPVVFRAFSRLSTFELSPLNERCSKT